MEESCVIITEALIELKKICDDIKRIDTAISETIKNIMKCREFGDKRDLIEAAFRLVSNPMTNSQPQLPLLKNIIDELVGDNSTGESRQGIMTELDRNCRTMNNIQSAKCILKYPSSRDPTSYEEESKLNTEIQRLENSYRKGLFDKIRTVLERKSTVSTVEYVVGQLYLGLSFKDMYGMSVRLSIYIDSLDKLVPLYQAGNNTSGMSWYSISPYDIGDTESFRRLLPPGMDITVIPFSFDIRNYNFKDYKYLFVGIMRTISIRKASVVALLKKLNSTFSEEREFGETVYVCGTINTNTLNDCNNLVQMSFSEGEPYIILQIQRIPEWVWKAKI